MENKKLNMLAGILEDVKYTMNLDKINRRELNRWRKNLKDKRTRQDFYLKDLVYYRGNSTHDFGVRYTYGNVIEVVKAGRYPRSPVRVRGYYKDYITYVILLNFNVRGETGEYRWCSSARLTLLGREIKGINKEKLELTSKPKKLSK
jgi:hypothetical protein